MEQKVKKSNKGIVIAIIVLVLAVAAAALVYVNFGKPATTEGAKKITVTVVHKDGTAVDFDYQTDAEYLGEVLKAEKLIEGTEGEYGLYITSVDGEAADESNQEWWCITKSQEQVNTSADQTPITDGDQFELTLTIGY